MSTRLTDSLAATELMAEIFSDVAVLQAMLDFETALARAEALAGVIPADAAEAITAAARAEFFDASSIARDAMDAGTVAIPLVKALTEYVRSANADAAGWVHWGATSHDVIDTSLVLLLRRARGVLTADQQRLSSALLRLSDEHARSVMLARTLLQPAPPTTFGLKAAAWRAAANRSWRRAELAFDEALILQFGGASGTLAALSSAGATVSAHVASELGLTLPEAPWHAHRDRLAALVSALGIYAGSLGKMACDLSLLMQHEVGEVSEGSPGGSSTMPNKRNPTSATIALAAAKRAPGLIGSYLGCMLQEHERGLGGWQAEWPLVRGIVEAAGVAVNRMANAAEELQVFPDRMRANIEATRGAVFAERAMIELGRTLGRDRAKALLEETLSSGRSLADLPEGHRLPADIDQPEAYLGSAEFFRSRLLKGHE
jgi:3-carboxy-cis,cis-muconate cycloisomerase